MSRNKLYTLLALACTAGYVWLYLNYKGIDDINSSFNVCLIKQVTDIPCPSCGSTRAVEAFLHGDFISTIYWNPFGLILISILIIIPVWLLIDLIRRNDSLHHYYGKAEIFLRKRKIAIIAILIVLANWVWNIEKGL